MVQVSRLGPDDSHALTGMLDLFSDVFAEPQNYSANRPTRRYMEDLLGSENFIAVAAQEDARVIGGLAAYLLKKFEQERSEIYIYDLAVAADRRREGIATALIDEVLGIAGSGDAHAVFIQADAGDAPAIALYSKLGSREEALHFDLDF